MKKRTNISPPNEAPLPIVDIARTVGAPDVSAMVEDFIEPEFYHDPKSGIITRAPTLPEQNDLMRAAQANGIDVGTDLRKGPAWIAELDGRIVGCIRARLVFEVGPFPVQSQQLTPKLAERAEVLMLEAFHRWMRSHRNGLGVEQSFQLTITPERQSALHRLGWKVMNFAPSTLFGKFFGGQHNGH